MGGDGESDWFSELSVRSAFAGVENAAGVEEAMERAGAPVVLEELPIRERKIGELTAALEKKQHELVAVQEDYRAYKIKAHTVLRQKAPVVPERDEDAEAARRRAEVQTAVERERSKMTGKVKEAEESAETARQEAAAAQHTAEEAKGQVREAGNCVEMLTDKVVALEEQLCSAAQRERESELEVANDKQERQKERQREKEGWDKEEERLRCRVRQLDSRPRGNGVDEAGSATTEHADYAQDSGVQGREDVVVLKRRMALLEGEVEAARQEHHNAVLALDASKEKAQAMLLDKDSIITSLRARLKSAGVRGGDTHHRDPNTSRSGSLNGAGEDVGGRRMSDGGGEGGALLAPSSDGLLQFCEEDAEGEGEEVVGRHLYFAPLEKSGMDRRPSGETQEDHILHVAQMQAQQTEYVASLLDKISILKENVSEGKRLQDLLCRERDQLREALEVVKKEADTTKRVERYNSKFREGTNIEYLKNVLLKYIETQDHEGLIPVLSSVLEFDMDEQRRLQAALSRMSSPWSKFGTKFF